MRKHTSIKAEWSHNRIYEDLYDKAKKIIKLDASMKFYDASRPPYLDTDASGVSHGAVLLQIREDMNCVHDEVQNNMILCPIAFAIKSSSNAKWWYGNIKWKPLAYSMT